MDSSAKEPWQLFSAADEALREFFYGENKDEYTQIVDANFEENPDMVVAGSYANWRQYAGDFVLDRSFCSRQRKRNVVGNKITLEQLVEEVKLGKSGRHKTILGSAGTGKTTTLKRFAKKVRGKDRLSPTEEGNKLVIVLDFRRIPQDTLMTSMEVVLRCMTSRGYSGRDTKKAFKWLINNQKKCTFLIDSLDTIPFSLEKEHLSIVYYDTEENSEVILYNLLSGALFPHAVIVSSSRENKVSNLPRSTQPETCILLDGFTQESVEIVARGLLGYKDGTAVLQYIANECPDIEPLLETPAFLIYALIALQDRSGFKPNNMAGIFLCILLNYVHDAGDDVRIALATLNDKLMPLAYDGMKQRRVLFSAKYLEDFKLSDKELKSFNRSMPQNQRTRLPTRLLVNDQQYSYFNHQSAQEFLAGLHSASKSVGEFKRFLVEEFQESDFAVVRKALFGLMLNEKAFQASKEINHVESTEEKRRLLTQELENQWKNATTVESRLAWFNLVQECKEDISPLVNKLVKELDFRGVKLGNDDLTAIGFVLRLSNKFELLDLRECGLDATNCRSLLKGARSKPAKVTELKIDGNHGLSEQGFLEIGKIVKILGVDSLSAQNCHLDSSCAKSLTSSIGGHQLEKVDVGRNSGLTVHDLTVLGECSPKIYYQYAGKIDIFLKRNRASKSNVFIVTCHDGVKDIDFARFRKWLSGYAVWSISLRNVGPSHFLKFLEVSEYYVKIYTLNIVNSIKLGTLGWFALGKICEVCKVENFVASDSNLNEAQVKNFLDGGKNMEFRILDLSNKEREMSYMTIFERVLSRVTGELILDGWEISPQDEENLQHQLNKLDSNKGVMVRITQYNREKILVANTSAKNDTASTTVEPSEEKAIGKDDDNENVEETLRHTTPPMFYPQRISHPLTKSAEVGINGGLVTIGERCSITFSRKAVLTPTTFHFSLDVLDSETPNNEMAVTPALSCQPTYNFRGRSVKIRLPLWCSTNSPDIMVNVVIENESSKDGVQRQIIHTVKLEGQKNFLEFDCPHFTNIWAYISRLSRFIWGAVRYDLKPMLFHHPHGNFLFALCINDEMVYEPIKRDAVAQNFEYSPIALNNIQIECDKEMTMQISCQDPADTIFVPEAPHLLKVGDIFAEDSISHKIPFFITPVPGDRQPIILLCVLTYNGKRGEYPFRIYWPEKFPKKQGGIKKVTIKNPIIDDFHA